jgi:hypothetical protein
MGDLETDFMEKIQDRIDLSTVDILFAPHHGRNSGKAPQRWLGQLNPRLIIIGEAPSEHVNYYAGYNTITQNSSGDLLFDCGDGEVDVYAGDNAYYVDHLDDQGLDHKDGLYYIGTLRCG